MTFRIRLLVAFLLAVLLPLIALALFVRNEMTHRLTAQYERRVDALVDVIEKDLTRERDAIRAALGQVRDAVAGENRFRRAAVDRAQDERRYLLDYAGGAMRLAGLSMLQIQDPAGRIVSSGHFRNDYDRLEPDLPKLLTSAPGGIALVRARTAGAPFLALAGIDSVDIGGKRFAIVGGVEAEARFLRRLSRDELLSVSLIVPDEAPADDGGGSREVVHADAIVRELNVPFVDSEHGELGVVTFRVSHSLDELKGLRNSIDRWFLITVAATGVLAVFLASWLTSRISRPLVDLAEKTSRIDLDRLDVEFDTGSRDEIGILSRGLGAMTTRLRESTGLLKDAERRATLGELARQVNHDIKNGLTPIRNVFRHLAEQCKDHPEQLPRVFHERQGTIDSSISYLERLASNYARLSRRGERPRSDLNDVVARAVADRKGAENVELRADLQDGVVVPADPLSLRRIVENLLDNAIDSLVGRGGRVTVSTHVVAGDSGEARVRLAVADTGIGMSKTEAARIFDDFYTTKADGSGLGLSIVRRLVMDFDGTVEVESEEGKGSRFVVDLPAAATTERGKAM